MFGWMSSTDLHPLLVSCIFHYEFEFIHPFADGNGRTGRLWHTLLLSHWRPPLTWIPIESVIRGRRADHYAAIADSNPVGGERFLCHLHAHDYQRCAHPLRIRLSGPGSSGTDTLVLQS